MIVDTVDEGLCLTGVTAGESLQSGDERSNRDIGVSARHFWWCRRLLGEVHTPQRRVDAERQVRLVIADVPKPLVRRRALTCPFSALSVA